jgi:glycerol kinase
MKREVVIAIDQGTTGSTVLAFDRAGRVLGRGYSPFPQHFPRPGWVEHRGDELLASVREACARALDQGGLQPSELVAVGITNQRETAFLWDRNTGEALHPGIVWQCRRSAAIGQAHREAGREPDLSRRTGLLLDPYFSATKWQWLLEQGETLARRARSGEARAGTVDSFLVHHLTGGQVHVTDPSNASRTLLLDLDGQEWAPDLLDCFGLPAAMMPRVVPTGGVLGTVRDFAPLPDGLPIAAIVGDQQAALFGQRAWTAGEGKCTYGTGCFLLVHTGDRPVQSHQRLLTTVAWEMGGVREFALEGSVFMGGATIQWLRDGLGLIVSADETEALARSVPDSGGVVLVPAFTGLGAPHWDPEARGTLLGLTRGTGRAHVVRAALEGVAFQVAELVEAMERDLSRPLASLRVDGGATANRFLLETQAGLLGLPVVRANQVESTAWGAAAIAGLATGFWTSRANLPEPGEVSTFIPDLPADARERRLATWRRAVDLARAWGEA